MQMLCFATLTIVSLLITCERSVAALMFVQESNDSQLRTLQEARRDMLKQLVDLYRAEDEISSSSGFKVSAACVRLAQSELEINPTPDQQVACIEAMRDAYRETELRIENDVEHGTSTLLNLLLAKASRLKVEAELNKARLNLAGLKMKGSNSSNDQIHRELEAEQLDILKLRYKTLISAREVLQSTAVPGASPLAGAFDVDEAIAETMILMTGRSEEGIRILEQRLATKLKDEEHDRHQRWSNELNDLAAKADRVRLAIVLHNAKAGKWPRAMQLTALNEPSHPMNSTDPELKALLVEYRDLLKTLRPIVEQYRAKGNVQSEVVIKVNNAYFGAELALAASPEESVEFLQDALKIQFDFEKEMEARFEVGVLPLSEFVLAKSERMKVEIELLKARERVAARNTEPASAVNQSVPLCAYPSMHRDSHRLSCDFRQKLSVGRIRKNSAPCMARCRATRKSASFP
ncbi:MAG: hypothetical protein JNM43_28135 [Planctomycetaceae bacterium]|nr:hypothetical protein [Planctomycetaceae bacterium]